MIAFYEECGKVREEICAEKIFVKAARGISSLASFEDRR